VSVGAELLTWPKSRTVHDTDGTAWVVTLEPARLDLTDGILWVTITDPDELRALGMAMHAAVLDHDQTRQVGKARGRARAHQLAILDGLPVPDRYRRYEDRR
jgi:hypothetical protein